MRLMLSEGNLIIININLKGVEVVQVKFLESLVRVHQVQSFTRAASMQGITLSALSMQMRTLEAEFNVSLFDRAFRPPKLTPLGRQVALQAANLLKEEVKLRAICGSDKRLSGYYRLGFIQSAGVRILPQFLKGMQIAAPDARVEVETGLSETLSEQVRSGHLDGAVITYVDEAATGLKVDIIAEEIMAIAVPESHAKAKLEQINAELPFIQFRPSTGIGKLIAKFVRNLTTAPPDILVLDGIEACIECVRLGLGYTLLPLPDLLRCHGDGLCIRSENAPLLQRKLAFVTRDDAISENWRPQILQVLPTVSRARGNRI